MGFDILSDMVITRVVSITTLYSNENIERHRTNRPMWAIVIKYEGETRYKSNGKEFVSNINNIAILPKGCSYDWKCVKAGHYTVIEFDCQTIYDNIFSFPVSNGEKILKSAKKLEYEMMSKNEFTRLECIKEVYAIILNLLQGVPRKYSSSDKQKKIAPAIDYIAQNYNQKLHNDTLASMCGLSTVYFRKLFTEVTKQSPLEYIQELKVTKAKEMLKSDYGNITDIASELGYQNIYDFSRSFKKLVGVSPKKFRDI